MVSILKNLIRIPLFLFLAFNQYIFLDSLASQPTFEKGINKAPINYKNNNDYILDTGDILTIVFSGIDSFNGNYPIRNDGSIFIPELNKFSVRGLTPIELERKLNLSYKEYIIDPNIKVFISSYRPVTVFLSGEIKRPGLYILKYNVSKNDYSHNEISNFAIIDDSAGEIINEFTTVKSPRVFDALRLGRGITKYADLSSVKVIRNNPKKMGGGE